MFINSGAPLGRLPVDEDFGFIGFYIFVYNNLILAYGLLYRIPVLILKNGCAIVLFQRTVCIFALQYPEIWKIDAQDPMVGSEGGESVADVAIRVIRALLRIEQEVNGYEYTHGWHFIVSMSEFLDSPYTAFDVLFGGGKNALEMVSAND